MPRIVLAVAAALLLLPTAPAAAPLASPEQFLGHPVGADRRLADWEQVTGYLELLAAGSPRVALEVAGASTLGRDIPLVVVTSERNHARLDEIRAAARDLANADRLGDAEAAELVRSTPAVVLVTGTIHATELGSTQMFLELAHELATTTDAEVEGWLDDVVLLLMPSINPDGQVMVVDWYREHLGTPYEGGRMPRLYHPYVGHDLNRDFYMLTQAETRAVNRVLYHRWFPQVFLDEHQMGSTGPRMFVPPQTDPLAPEVHSLIFRQADLLGTLMALRLEEAGKTGVGSNMIFDSYWPGGTRNTAWWKNVVGLLTEVASPRLATPLYVDPGELRGGGKGLPEYGRRANFPSPWPGGWWRLRDVVEYELVATRALLEGVAEHRADLLDNLVRMAREAAAAGRTGPPAAFVIPPEQHDPVAARRLAELLLEHGVRLEVAEEPLAAGRLTLPAGSFVVPADQPYRPFLLTMLRPQRYPEVVPYVGGPVLPPYDATHWSLPLSMGVEVLELAELPEGQRQPVDVLPPPDLPSGPAPGGWLIPHAADSAAVVANRLLARGAAVHWLDHEAAGGTRGDLWVPPSVGENALLEVLGEAWAPARPLGERPTGAALRLQPVRVGLYRPWSASMDEGWTRFVLERHGFTVVSLAPADLRGGAFADRVDVLLLADIPPDLLATGTPKDEDRRRWYTPLPPQYEDGIGEDGAGHLRTWIEGGGTAVALNRSGGYLVDLLDLPVRDLSADAKGFSCPGTLLRVEMDLDHPLAWGMRREDAAYCEDSPIFATRPPDGRFARRVIARYPADERDVLLSGHLGGAEHLERRPAAVEVEVGDGRVVLIGFRPQYRAQTHRTFKLLFNAMFLATAEPLTLGD